MIKGADFEVEFDNISTAISTKADTASPTFSGTVNLPANTNLGGTPLTTGIPMAKITFFGGM